MKRIRSDKIILEDKLFDGYVYFDNGKITDVTANEIPVSEEYDMTGYYVSAGFIDIHTHGGGGNALLALGSIATMVFSKQISSGIMTTISNFRAMKDNTDQVNASMDLLKQFKTVLEDPGADHFTKRIVELEEKIMSLTQNRGGYLKINLCKNNKYKTFSIHQLVAKAFLKKEPTKIEVNHINGIKTDNRVENLKVLLRSEHTTLHNMQKEIIRNELGQIIGVIKSGNIGEGCDANPEITEEIKASSAS